MRHPISTSFIKTALALLAALVLLPVSAYSWGWPEHKLIVSMAQSRLSAQAKEGIRQILGNADIVELAPCADQIIYAPANCGGIHFDAAPETKSWHYINLPIGSKPTPAAIQQHCPKGNCAPAQVKKELLALNDPGLGKREKLMALMLMLHFVGDIHQPLHCSDNNDAGGNALKVSFMNVPTNLHSLWDHMMYTYSTPQVVVDASTSPASNMARLIEKDLRNDSPITSSPYISDRMDLEKAGKALEKDLLGKDTASWTSGDVVASAVIESFQTAEDTVYPHYAQLENNTLTDKDAAAVKPVFADRIERAAVRLAHLLNLAFKMPPPDSATKMTPPEVPLSDDLNLQLPK